jgi:hypothetical protein
MSNSRTLAAFLLLLNSAIGAVAPPTDNEQTKVSVEAASSSKWLTFYYRKPEPERFVVEVRKMSKAEMLTKPGAEPPTLAFLSRVLAANPEKIEAWMKALADLPEGDKAELHRAIWFSDTKESKAYLKDKSVAKYVNKDPPDILQMEIESPDVLDMLWGYFFATGEEAPIRRIVSAFNYSTYFGAVERYKSSKQTAEDKKNALNDAIFRAAMWSLGSNCQQHPRVREHCDSLLKGNGLNATEARVLKVVLAAIDAKKDAKGDGAGSQWLQDGKTTADKEWMKSNQGFGAQLLFFDNPKKFLDDWKKPTEGVRASVSESAPRGTECGAFIIFTGCGDDKQGMADVVADVTVIKPDGKPYAAEKGMEVWQKKPAPKGKQLQLGTGGLMIKIEADDPAGTYEIRATVHDRVKDVTLDLKRKFTVSK